MKKGGDYYLISRTLGVEFGGAIGLVLFLAQAVSIGFYCIGFAEAVTGLAGWEHPRALQLAAAGAALVLFTLSWFGADVATKFQFVVMAVLASALASFFWGTASTWSSEILSRSWTVGEGSPSFWVIFAVFFPAVTGFTQGVSMSGDLREPAKSLPLGTFAAVGLSTLVYFGAVLAFAGSSPLDDLATDYEAMRRVASVPWLIDAGVIGATLSSAMASFLGAPRILQALAGDKVFGVLTPFAKGVGPMENPRRGVLLSAGICVATIAMGNLNLIAAVVSMFFLVSYSLLNYATFFEARAGSPFFRPRFRWFDQRLSLAGALLCLGAMLAIGVTAALTSAAVLFGLYQYVKRTADPSRWADSKRAEQFRRVREELLAMQAGAEHARDWRPQILAFSDDPGRRDKLLRFARWIEGGSGLTTAVRVLLGEGALTRKQRVDSEQELRRELEAGGFQAFPLVIATPDLMVGARMLLQAYGVGPLRANIILLNWLEQLPGASDPGSERRYGSYLRAALRLELNVVVLEADEDEWKKLVEIEPARRRIDVWWRDDATSRLLLILAYLMTRTEFWNEAEIRVFAFADASDADEESKRHLTEYLEEVRIDARAEVVRDASADSVAEKSSDATIVFVPMLLKGDQPLDSFGGNVQDLVSRLPVTALGIAGAQINLRAEPDEGPAAERGALEDRRSRALARASQLEKDAERAEGKATEAEERLRVLSGEELEEGERGRLEAEAEKLRAESDDAQRRAIKARAVAKLSEEELGVEE